MAKREIPKKVQVSEVRAISKDLSLPDFLEQYGSYYPISSEDKRLEIMTGDYERLQAANYKSAAKHQAKAEDKGTEEFNKSMKKKS